MKKKIMFLLLIFLIVILVVLFWGAFNRKNNKLVNEVNGEMNDLINVEINDVLFKMELENNETAREFQKMLPLEIEMNELNGNEKYYYFNDSFSNNPINVSQIKAGDVMLFGDDCLVIFYEDFSTSYSYTRIGRIVDSSNLKDVLGESDVVVSFEK